MKYEFANPKTLEPAAYNPRKMKPAEMDKLRRSLREFGMVQPIIVQMPGNRIIAGHQRVEAAIAEGLDKVPVHRLRISDAKAKAMNLALNRIHGDWDDEKLKSLLGELKEVERSLTGFDEDEITKLLSDSLEGKTVEQMEVKPAPDIVWYLIGIPLDRLGGVQEHIAALENNSDLCVQSSRNK